MRLSLAVVKSRLFSLSVRSVRTFTGIVGFRPMHMAMTVLLRAGLGRLVLPVWSACLQQMNRRETLVRWTKPQGANPAQYRIYFHMRALNIARDFRGCIKFHESTYCEKNEKLYTRKQKWIRNMNIELGIAAMEMNKEFGDDFCFGSERAKNHFYGRIWEAHGYKNMGLTEKYIRIYSSMTSYDIPVSIHVIDNILFPNGQFDLAEEIAEKALAIHREAASGIHEKRIMEFLHSAYLWDLPGSRKELRKVRSEHEYEEMLRERHLRARLELGKAYTEEEEEKGKCGWRHVQELHQLIWEANAADAASAESLANRIVQKVRFIHRISLGEQLRRQLLMLAHATIAELHEIMGNFDIALLHYEEVSRNTDADWLTEQTWRYVSLLFFLGRNAEASIYMLDALARFWKSFERLSRRKIEKRIRKGKLVLPKAFILAGWGIGDIIISLGILQQLRRPGSHYGCGGDPRLKELLEPGNEDWLEVVPSSRTTGPHAVSERQYWADREGVPAGLDQHRVTRAILKKVRKYGDVMLAEDAFVAGLVQGMDFPHDRSHLIKITDAETEGFRKWLNTLPGKLKVGFSWRSGEVNMIRNKSYTRIEEWEELFRLADVDVINLQYSDTSAEKEIVQRQFGGMLHEHPDVHLTNDLRRICALARACDIVIAPCTAVREMAGACGAETWSLTITPVAPDWWRIAEDGRTDRIFPSIRHFTYYEFGSKQKVIDAMVAEIRQRLAQLP